MRHTMRPGGRPRLSFLVIVGRLLIVAMLLGFVAPFVVLAAFR